MHYFFGCRGGELVRIPLPYFLLSLLCMDKSDYPPRQKLYGLFIVTSLFVLLFLNLYLHMNSIFVTSGLFIICSVVILLMRRDLLKPVILSATAITVYVLVIYNVLFNAIFPDFWDKYWLLANTAYGITMLGNIPITEILWYVNWAIFAGVSYPFASGKSLAR